MAKNTVPIIIGAVLFGLLAVGLTFYVLSGATGGGPSPTPSPTAAVASTPAQPAGGHGYVAARTIYPRTILTSDMMTPSDNAAPGAITDPKTVIGRLANKIIRQGEAVTGDAVTSGVARVIPANIAIPVGLRGVAIWVDPDQTAAGLVDVGDRVDVIAAHDLVGGKTTTGATSVDYTAGHTIVQDLEVLAVDKSISQFHSDAPPASTAPANTPPGQTPPAAAPTPTPTPGAGSAPQSEQAANGQNNGPHRIRVILAASPADAQRLVTANKQGQLNITIRNPSSHERLALTEMREHPSGGGIDTAAARARREKLEDEARARREKIADEVRARNYAREDMKEKYQHDFQMKLPPMSLPNPNRIQGATGIEPSSSKEVTVIRGTEKTRVVVPR